MRTASEDIAVSALTRSFRSARCREALRRSELLGKLRRRVQCLCLGVLGVTAGARTGFGHLRAVRFPGSFLGSSRSRLALPLVVASASMSADAVVPPSETERLGALWAEAYEGWVAPPGSSESGAVYLAPWDAGSPAGSDGQCLASSAPWVEEILKLADTHGGVFGLTAFNPLGQDKPHEENLAKNAELEKEIKTLCDSTPGSVWWRSFGFATDWHEKGFTVAAPEAKVVELAKKYNQGAVYRFYRNSNTSACAAPIMRATVPALMTDTEADVPMVPVTKPGFDRADPTWAPSE